MRRSRPGWPRNERRHKGVLATTVIFGLIGLALVTGLVIDQGLSTMAAVMATAGPAIA